jgi:hypothetical protein
MITGSGTGAVRSVGAVAWSEVTVSWAAAVCIGSAEDPATAATSEPTSTLAVPRRAADTSAAEGLAVDEGGASS